MTVEALPALLRRHGVAPRGVVHVGAHLGQEVPAYRAAGFARIVLVEPHPVLAAALREMPGVEVVEGACAAEPGTGLLHVTSHDKLSSLQEPVAGRRVVATVDVAVHRLAELVDATVNVAVIDAQGVELEVLAGAPLDTLEVVVVETYVRRKQGGAPAHAEVVGFMARQGWVPVAQWPLDRAGRNLDVVFARPR
ncbi:FkbM family methyltransferase [Streptomonospora arabica]|uniref:FkbM family methyltransferase n=1 Tax=Streptomonospora arabica TaxID=412417 RepID=A0ABV9SSK1_9ACTN